MNSHQQQIVESFATTLLAGRTNAAVQTSQLGKAGYDTSLLLELVTAYMELPASERTFSFEKDFAKMGTPHDFGLLIRRL